MITATSLTGRRFTARGLTGRSLSGFSFRDLFNGYDGAWYEPSANTQFTTSAGSTLAGAGDPVGRFEDSSGSGHHATQPTSGSRPIKAREPVGGRRNEFIRTEEFDDAIWVKFGVTIDPNVTTAPDGTLTADKAIPSASSSNFKELQRNISATEGLTYTFSKFVKQDGHRYVQVIGDSTGFGTFRVNYDLQDGAETAFDAGTSTVIDRGIVDEGGGWFRVYASVVCLSTGSRRMALNYIPDASSARGVTWASDGVSGTYIWGAQMELGALSPYQRVVTQYDVTEAGVPSVSFTRYDGVDDLLDTGVERMGNTGLFCGPGERFFVAGVFRTTSTAARSIICRGSTINSGLGFTVTADGKAIVGARGSSTDLYAVANDDEWKPFLINWDGTTLTARSADGTVTCDVGETAEESGQRIIIGAINNGASAFMLGDQSTLIIRDYDLTPAQQSQVMNKLAAQVGVTL